MDVMQAGESSPAEGIDAFNRYSFMMRWKFWRRRDAQGGSMAIAIKTISGGQLMGMILPKDSAFINFSNHPSDLWSEAQTDAALSYATRIVDLPFPQVDPTMDEQAIDDFAQSKAEEILSMRPAAVMCQGEFGLSYAVIRRLLDAGIVVLYACSERKVHVNGNVKSVQFDFVRFRRFG